MAFSNSSSKDTKFLLPVQNCTCVVLKLCACQLIFNRVSIIRNINEIQNPYTFLGAVHDPSKNKKDLPERLIRRFWSIIDSSLHVHGINIYKLKAVAFSGEKLVVYN